MGKLSGVAVAAALAFSATAASAQAGFSIAGGPTFASGDALKALNTDDVGYHVQASLGISAPMLPVGLRIDGLFNQFPGDGAELRTFSGNANAVLTIPSLGIVPYIIGGVGLYNNDIQTNLFDPDAENDFGFNVGAGVRFSMPGLGIFVEGRLHSISTEGESTRFIPLSIGFRF